MLYMELMMQNRGLALTSLHRNIPATARGDACLSSIAFSSEHASFYQHRQPVRRMMGLLRLLCDFKGYDAEKITSL